MRNAAAGFEIPFAFSWPVDPQGHQWIDDQSGSVLVAQGDLDPTKRGIFEREVRISAPLEQHTGLFREFAALEPAEPAIKEFADRLGLLGTGERTLVKIDSGSHTVFGEPLKGWRSEISAMKAAVQCWDFLCNGDSSALNELKRQFEQQITPMPIALQRWHHLDKDDPAMLALGLIQRSVESRLSECVPVGLRFRGNTPRLHLSLVPRNLKGALWLQFAAAVDGLKKYEVCAQCQASFEISRAPTTGKRPDARFCSDRCRVAHHRRRVSEAQRLKLAKLSIQQIADRLGTTPKTVAGWVKTAKPKTRRR